MSHKQSNVLAGVILGVLMAAVIGGAIVVIALNPKPAECCNQHGAELQMIDGRLSAIEGKCKPCECKCDHDLFQTVFDQIAANEKLIDETNATLSRIEFSVSNIRCKCAEVPEAKPYTPPAGPVPSLPEPKPVKPTTKVGKAVDCK